MAKSKTYEYVGVVDRVGEVETFSNGKFRKQTLVVGPDVDFDGKYPPSNPFDFKNDCIGEIAGVSKGMRVKVVFTLDGRVWNDPKTGKDRFFAGCTAFKCEILEAGCAVPDPATPPDGGSVEIDDMPF